MLVNQLSKSLTRVGAPSLVRFSTPTIEEAFSYPVKLNITNAETYHPFYQAIVLQTNIQTEGARQHIIEVDIDEIKLSRKENGFAYSNLFFGSLIYCPEQVTFNNIKSYLTGGVGIGAVIASSDQTHLAKDTPITLTSANYGLNFKYSFTPAPMSISPSWNDTRHFETYSFTEYPENYFNGMRIEGYWQDNEGNLITKSGYVTTFEKVGSPPTKTKFTIDFDLPAMFDPEPDPEFPDYDPDPYSIVSINLYAPIRAVFVALNHGWGADVWNVDDSYYTVSDVRLWQL